MKSITGALVICLFANLNLHSQDFERYKKLIETSLNSTYLGFEKNLEVTVPLEWQSEIDKDFPLIVIFDKQNERSYGYILQTIDYLTSNEQMPSCVIIGVESTQEYRYLETAYKPSDAQGLAKENEEFVFKELIPLAREKYKASDYSMFIGHSRYGYFTSALLTSGASGPNAIISLSPFFRQKNVDLTDSIARFNARNLEYPMYYRFGIGNDYPEEFHRMDSVLRKLNNPMLNAKGVLYKEAEHNVTPGLTIGSALYDVFEQWAAIQSVYISNDQTDLSVLNNLEKDILYSYGSPLSFSLGILNGKGWFFYNEENYEKAIEAWEILLKNYPNFSEAYLYILDAQTMLKKDISNTKELYRKSLEGNQFYTKEEMKELIEEYEKLE